MNSPPPTSNTTTDLLQSALSNLQIKDECASTLHKVLETLEVSEKLSRELCYRLEMNHLETKLMSVNQMNMEYRALLEDKTKQQEELADRFLCELFVTLVKLQELQEFKNQNEEKLMLVDDLEMKLRREEEMVRALRRQASLNIHANRNLLEQQDESSLLDMPSPSSSSLYQMEWKIPTDDDDAVSKEGEQAKDSTITQNNYKTIEDEASSNTTNNNSSSQSPSEHDKIKVDEDNETVKSNRLQDDAANKPTYQKEVEETLPVYSIKVLPPKLLLPIFAHLEAIDVFNVAQLDAEFYNSVDQLFGLGEGLLTSSSSKQDKSNVSKSSNRVSATVLSNNTEEQKDVEAGKQQQGFFSQRPSFSALYNSMIAASPTPNKNRPPLAPSSSQKQIASSGSSLTSIETPKKSSTPTKSQGSPGLTSNIAVTMADKLSPQELAILINMTNKLKQREAEIKKLVAEKDDLAARLEGTEAVKEFMVTKVQNAEKQIEKLNLESSLKVQQIESDQEVISYLDMRVKELETKQTELLRENKILDVELKSCIDKNKKSQKVLENMLNFEREQLVSHEKESARTKKILVKEVKNCHAQITTLKAERDSFQQQMQQLKQALLKRGH